MRPEDSLTVAERRLRQAVREFRALQAEAVRAQPVADNVISLAVARRQRAGEVLVSAGREYDALAEAERVPGRSRIRWLHWL